MSLPGHRILLIYLYLKGAKIGFREYREKQIEQEFLSFFILNEQIFWLILGIQSVKTTWVSRYIRYRLLGKYFLSKYVELTITIGVVILV